MKQITLRPHSLRRHLLLTPLRYTRDSIKANASRFTWREVGPKEFVLTPLGVLNGLIGLELRVQHRGWPGGSMPDVDSFEFRTLPWHIQHSALTGHVTQQSLEDPGSCKNCKERSPAYGLPKMVVPRSSIFDRPPGNIYEIPEGVLPPSDYSSDTRLNGPETR